MFSDVFSCQKFYEARQQSELWKTHSKREHPEESSVFLSHMNAQVWMFFYVPAVCCDCCSVALSPHQGWAVTVRRGLRWGLVQASPMRAGWNVDQFSYTVKTRKSLKPKPWLTSLLTSGVNGRTSGRRRNASIQAWARRGRQTKRCPAAGKVELCFFVAQLEPTRMRR